MKKKFSVLLSIILLISMLFTGCSNSGGGTGGKKILRSNNSSEPGSLDPPLAQGTHESWILRIFEGLMTFDEKELVQVWLKIKSQRMGLLIPLLFVMASSGQMTISDS